MGQEVELKLLLGPNGREQLLQHPLLVNHASETQQLNNTYFDTKEQALSKARCALRIRKKADSYIQTLKTRGQSLAGLSQRGEWEWPVEAVTLQPDLLTDDIWPSDINKSELQAVFNTDFSRTQWLIEFQNAEIELVLDEGEILADNKRALLNEVELELIKGSAADVFALALTLSESVPLIISDINKAERGYRLHNDGNYRIAETTSLIPADQNLNAAMTQVLSGLLNQAHRYLEVFECTSDWMLLKCLLHKYEHIAQLLQSLKGDLAAPAALTADLDWLIEGLIQVLLPAQLSYSLFIDKGTNSKGLSQRILKNLQAGMAISLQQLLSNNRFGRTGLRLGQFLLQLQSWKSDERWQDNLNQSCTLAYTQYLASGNLQDLRKLQHCLQLMPDSDVWIGLLEEQLGHLEVATGMQLVDSSFDTSQDPDDKAKAKSWARRLTVVQRDIQQQLSVIQLHKPIW